MAWPLWGLLSDFLLWSGTVFLYFSLSSSVSNNLLPPWVWTMDSPLEWIHPPRSSVEHAAWLTEGYWSSAKRGGSWTPERNRRAIHSSWPGSALEALSSAFHRISQRLLLFFSPLDLAGKRRLLCTWDSLSSFSKNLGLQLHLSPMGTDFLNPDRIGIWLVFCHCWTLTERDSPDSIHRVSTHQ